LLEHGQERLENDFSIERLVRKLKDIDLLLKKTILSNN